MNSSSRPVNVYPISPELQDIIAHLKQLITHAIKKEIISERIPGYLKFPEDIFAMLGGHVAQATIRGWKTAGYLRTTPIGTKTFVKLDDWLWFEKHHKELMAKDPRNRGNRLGKKNGG